MSVPQRIAFGVIVGFVNFIGTVVWGVMTLEYSGGPVAVALNPIGLALAGYFLVLTIHSLVRPIREHCSVVVLTAGLLLGDAALASTSFLNPWLKAVGLNNIAGLLIYLLVPIAIVTWTTFWKESSAVRISLTTISMATWIGFAALLRIDREWKFANGEYIGPLTARYMTKWSLVSTLPILFALLVTFWRDRRVSSA
jgi:hypothetical protein